MCELLYVAHSLIDTKKLHVFVDAWLLVTFAALANDSLRPPLYMVLSGVALSGMYVLAKRYEDYGPLQLVFFRAIGTFVPTLAYLLYHKVALLGNDRPRLMLRGVTGMASLTLFFAAVALVPITAGVALRYLSPLFAVGFVALTLGERVRPMQWLLLALAFAGVLLIKGFDPRVAGLGLALILASSLLDGVTFTVIRRLGTTEHPMVIVAYFTGICTLVAALGLLLFPSQWHTITSTQDLYGLVAIGIFGLVGQIFMTIAMQTGRAALVMPVKYVEVIFVLLAGSLWLDETYGWISLVGIGLIMAANVVNVQLARRPPGADDAVKKSAA